MLRFGSDGAMEGVDGGRPTSRGLPPAAFWGDGGCGKTAAVPKKGFSRVCLGYHSKCNRKERIGHRKALC